jgi:predicted GNAT family N-acyltransferase
VGTGRLLQQVPGVARIGRMAVHRALRGSGVGKHVLQALLDVAANRGDYEAMLHAQRSAEDFYLGLGFVARGEPFEEAGIAHIEMSRTLGPI